MEKVKKIAIKKLRASYTIRCEKGLIEKARSLGVDVNTALENHLLELIELLSKKEAS